MDEEQVMDPRDAYKPGSGVFGSMVTPAAEVVAQPSPEAQAVAKLRSWFAWTPARSRSWLGTDTALIDALAAAPDPVAASRIIDQETDRRNQSQPI